MAGVSGLDGPRFSPADSADTVEIPDGMSITGRTGAARGAFAQAGRGARERTRCGADRAGLALRAALGLRGSGLSKHLRSSDDSFGMRGRRVRFGEGVEEEVVNSGIRSVLSQWICCVALTFAPSKSFRVSNFSLCAVTTVGFDGGRRR